MVETRSMIYTEYFVKGTQPTTVCPLHEPRSFMDAIAGVFGKDSGPPPMPVGATGLPVPSTPERPSSSAPAAQPAPATTAARPGEEPAAPKKRGFWSRIFGGGGDKSEADRRKEEERRKQEQKKEEERRKKSEGR
jgi:hypothetical protein